MKKFWLLSEIKEWIDQRRQARKQGKNSGRPAKVKMGK